jgi:hypothetical protein
MGWTGCFPRGDSLQRLPRSNRRSSPWTQPPRSRWPRTASTSARRSVVGFDMRAYSHQGHGPRADQTGRIQFWDFRYLQALLRNAAGPPPTPDMALKARSVSREPAGRGSPSSRQHRPALRPPGLQPRSATKMTSGQCKMNLLTAGRPLLALWRRPRHLSASLFHLFPQDRVGVVTVQSLLFRGEGC